MLKHLLILGLVGVLGGLARTASAAPGPASLAPIERLLRAIDVVPPDRAALEAAVPNAWHELDRVARDRGRDTWSRIRAVSLMSFYPEPRTRTTLETLADDGDTLVRAEAVYTLGRGFGPVADAPLVRFIAARVADRERDVAERALRALRWVDHIEAGLTLERLARGGPEALRDLARTTIQRRAARLAREP